MKKILIIFGGNSKEHSISCKSAYTIINNLDRTKYQSIIVGIYKCNWYIFDDNLEMLLDNTWQTGNIIKIDNIIEFLKTFDKVFPIIHGTDFEDGNLSGLFNLFNIDYVGSNVLGNSISYDKDITKKICQYYNIPQVNYITLNNNRRLKSITLKYPVIIKPATCGSSIGINIAKNIKDVNKYVKEAFLYSNKVIIEEFIKARELECAILKDKKLRASSIGEIKSSNEFYDYNAKYINESKLIIPAKIEKSLANEIQKYSKQIFNILSLSNLSRIDFLYDYNNHLLYFNEVNTMPGFTDISMYPLLFNYDKITTKELISKLLEY